MSTTETTTGCIGQTYRADVYQGTTKRGFGLFVRLNKQVRLSCPGCRHCSGVDDMLADLDSNPIKGLMHVKHGQLYTLQIEADSVDDETGYVDACHLKVCRCCPA